MELQLDMTEQLSTHARTHTHSHSTHTHTHTHSFHKITENWESHESGKTHTTVNGRYSSTSGLHWVQSELHAMSSYFWT